MPRSRSLITNTGVWKPLGQVERLHRHLVALARPTRAAAAGAACRRATARAANSDVALRGARRQPGRRADALDVEDHRRDLGVVRRGRRTRPSARCRGPTSTSSRARPPSPRRSPCRARRSRPRPARSRTSPCRSPCPCGTSACSRSASRSSDEDGVIGYQATTVTPANMQPMRRGGVAFDQDLARRSCSSARRGTGRASSRCVCGVLEAGVERAHVERQRLRLLAQLLGRAPSPSRRARSSSSYDEHAVVDHVRDEPAQLGVGADRRRRSCRTAPDRRSRSVAQRVQLQRLVVDARPRPARATARPRAPSPGSSRRGSRSPSCGAM